MCGPGSVLFLAVPVIKFLLLLLRYSKAFYSSNYFSFFALEDQHTSSLFKCVSDFLCCIEELLGEMSLCVMSYLYPTDTHSCGLLIKMSPKLKKYAKLNITFICFIFLGSVNGAH